MNNPSPLVPQGSLLEQHTRSRSRVKVAFFCVVGIHVVGLMVLLMQGCKREQPAPEPDASLPTLTDIGLPPMDTNISLPPVDLETNIPAPPAPEPTPVPVPQPAVREYVIERGDTFYGIGKKLNIPMKALQDANPNVNPSKLQIGRKIVIPEVAPSATSGAVSPGGPTPGLGAGGEQMYTVKSGDNLTKIAKQHGTTVKALRAVNNLKTDRIKVGEKLTIPPKSAPAAPAPLAPPPVTPPPIDSYPAPAPTPVPPA